MAKVFDELLTVPMLARLAGISRGTAWVAVRAREIPSVRVGRAYAVRRADAEAFRQRVERERHARVIRQAS